MAGCQYDGSHEFLSGMGANPNDFAVMYQQVVHARFKPHLASARFDLLTQLFDDTGQFIGSDVRMGIGQDGRACPKLTKYLQDAVHATPFFTTGVELAV